MPIAFRVDLTPFLAEFIEQHRGLRLGRMFGRPAGYAGRKLFVCVIDDALVVKLPERVAKDEVGRGKASVSRSGRETRRGVWVTYTPRTARQASRLAPILEVAARHVAVTA